MDFVSLLTLEVIVLFFLELFVLFLLSRSLQKKLSQFFFLITKSVKWTVYLLSLLFFPGTLIHEVAHYLMARLLFVPTGKMKLLPELEGQSVKLGSVAIGKSDPLRRLLIGVAPFLCGTTIILLTLILAEKNQLWGSLWMAAILLYVLFEIGNSMFSSKKDLEGAMFFVVLFAIVSVALYILGVRISLNDLRGLINNATGHMFYQGVLYLLIPIGLDLALILFLSISNKLLRR